MTASLLYRGPSREDLHETYAKRGRTDGSAPVLASASVLVAAPPERVWHVLADPSRWHEADPAIHDVVLSGGVAVDAPFTWRNGRSSIRSQFAVVEVGRELTWTGRSSGANAVHRNVLAAEAGGTRLTSEESMSAPFLGLLFPSAKLEAGLRAWVEGIARASEG